MDASLSWLNRLTMAMIEHKGISTTQTEEGFADVLGFKIFYKSFEPVESRGVLLCVHGGPGATHDYLLPLAELTRWGYRVIFYDMRGCGRSQPVDEGFTFTIGASVEELEGLREGLGLGMFHLFGHSLGGAVALAYAVKYQQNLTSLMVCSGFASVPQLESAMLRLKSDLPSELQLAVRISEETRDYSNPEYRAAVRELIRRHYSRELKDEAQEHAYTLAHMNRNLYRTGWGPNDFVITGTMKDWDITKSLCAIHVPCLITVGKYDEIPQTLAESMHKEIAGSKLVVFNNSSHLAMWEEKGSFTKHLADFLSSIPRKS